MGAHLCRFDNWRVLSGVVIDTDFDRSLAARIATRCRRSVAIRHRTIVMSLMIIATTRVVHDRTRQRAGKYRLHLQRPDRQYEQEESSQE